MPKADGTPRKKSGPMRIISRVFARKKEPEWHWFDHPEMQARIAEAEADLREGRFESGTTVEGLLGHAPAKK